MHCFHQQLFHCTHLLLLILGSLYFLHGFKPYCCASPLALIFNFQSKLVSSIWVLKKAIIMQFRIKMLDQYHWIWIHFSSRSSYMYHFLPVLFYYHAWYFEFFLLTNFKIIFKKSWLFLVVVLGTLILRVNISLSSWYYYFQWKRSCQK